MRIILSGGGTAGHIMPLLAVAQEIKLIDPSCEITFVGQKGDRNVEIIKSSKEIADIKHVHSGKLRRYHGESIIDRFLDIKTNLLNLRDMFLVVVGFVESVFLLAKLKPNVIFFKGGYICVPIGFAARMLKIIYVTHDSDTIPGLANRLLAPGAVKNAVAHSAINYPESKKVVTGIPLSGQYKNAGLTNRDEAKAKLGIKKNEMLLFVYCGTQGAKVVFDQLEIDLPPVLKEFPKLRVVQVLGRLNEKSINDRYRNISKHDRERIKLLDFTDKSFDYISAADLIISRAGATSLAEFATIGRCSIIIPADQLTGGHQISNAKVFADRNAAVVIRESELKTHLGKAMRQLLVNDKLRQQYEESIKFFQSSDSAYRIARLLVEATKK